MSAEETQLRDEICRVGRSLFERGYVHATAGNISVRLDDGFLITPTDASLGALDPARLARLDAAGVQTGGETSGACVQALGVDTLRIGPQIEPGVPWCHATPPTRTQGLHLALKSGNFGGVDFFTRAFEVLR